MTITAKELAQYRAIIERRLDPIPLTWRNALKACIAEIERLIAVELEYEQYRDIAIGERRALEESKDVEIARLNAQLREWEKYTGFLYAHGFFRDNTIAAELLANPPAPNEALRIAMQQYQERVTLTTTQEPPHV